MTETPESGPDVRPGVKRFVYIVLTCAGLLVGGFLVLAKFGPLSQNELALVLNKTFADLLETPAREPALRIDLAAEPGRNASLAESTAAIPISARPPAARRPAASDKTAAHAVASSSGSGQEGIPANQTPQPVRECAFGEGGAPDHRVLINEIAWMGSTENASDEWLELRNNSGEDISLANWRLLSGDESLKIVFGPKDGIKTGDFLLLERSDDGAVPGIPADKIYSGTLSNTKVRLKLFEPNCVLADEADASGGWSKLGGDNKTKQTLERNLPNFGWHTSLAPGGTPRAQNAFLIDETISYGAPAQSSLPPATPVPVPASPANPTTTSETAPPAVAATPLISEIMAGSDAGSADEFIELWNPGETDIDLTGWYIKKKSSSGAESGLVAAARLEGARIPAHKRFLIANEGGYKGAVAPDAKWATSNTLAYTNNAIVLYAPDGTKKEEISWTEIPRNQSYARQESGNFEIAAPSSQNSGM